MNAKNTVFDVKRLIGRNIDDQVIQDDIKNWPFGVVKNEAGKPSVSVDFKGETKGFHTRRDFVYGFE